MVRAPITSLLISSRLGWLGLTAVNAIINKLRQVLSPNMRVIKRISNTRNHHAARGGRTPKESKTRLARQAEWFTTLRWSSAWVSRQQRVRSKAKNQHAKVRKSLLAHLLALNWA